ncbi:MAG: UDP-N-acetylmuramoyl-tripeptide--D-alanyl-D-alanine ligase [Phycisphaerae bacterium]|nr:UDP-N-acetylmuramoyl-tripeptide--D-alanyl-D-alanine ligase [Phycisphaerae bacterium]
MKPLGLDEIAAAMQARPLGQPGRYVINRVTTDSRQVTRGDLFFAIRGERFDGHGFVASAIDQGVMAAVVSDPDLVPDDLHQLGLLLLVDDTTAALGRLAAYHRRQVRATVIAVTGSNGKTTTKEMIHQVLGGRYRGGRAPKSFNNAIGVPLTLLSVDSSDDYVVVEIGTNAPGEVAQLASIASPDIGVITSVAETHLEKLGDLEGVAGEKARLVEHIRDGGCAIVNGDSEILAKKLPRRRRRGPRQISFGRGEGVDLRATHVRARDIGVSFQLDGDGVVTIPMHGEHNVLNALASIAVGRELGVEPPEAAGRLAELTPPPMRMGVRRWERLTLINDAYNANPASMAAALGVLTSWSGGGRRVFIAGDMRELGEVSLAKHRELGERIAEAGVGALLAVGEFAASLADAAERRSRNIRVHVAATTQEMAEQLPGILAPDDVVLLKGSRAVGLEALVEPIEVLAGGMSAAESD